MPLLRDASRTSWRNARRASFRSRLQDSDQPRGRGEETNGRWGCRRLMQPAEKQDVPQLLAPRGQRSRLRQENNHSPRLWLNSSSGARCSRQSARGGGHRSARGDGRGREARNKKAHTIASLCFFCSEKIKISRARSCEIQRRESLPGVRICVRWRLPEGQPHMPSRWFPTPHSALRT